MGERGIENPSAEQAMQSSADTREKTIQAQRDQTDESLRVERSKTDASLVENRATIEEEADEVVRIARERADKVVKTARDDADREHADRQRSSDAEVSSQRQRTREDVVVEGERSTADAVLQRERQERYLADFLAVERDNTDEDLIGERAHADTVIAARDEFLATVSHDLRSLLGSLAFNAELLIESAPAGEGGEKLRKYAGTSRRLVARMNRLIKDLLDIASIDAGKLTVVPEHVEVAQILRDIVEAFGPIAAAKRITLDAEPPELPLHAKLDNGRILQVLANLVSNAIKFTPEEGKVSIQVRPVGNEIQFAVSDTGIGISEEELPGVFGRFRQVSKDRRGLGLGLHISKCIVEAHGGRMGAESKVAIGSRFHFSLPAESAQSLTEARR